MFQTFLFTHYLLNDSLLECIAPFVALLLSPPDKVQRGDGQLVKSPERIHTIDEIKEVIKILYRKDFLLV
jgi:hypothetical protein